MSETGRSEKTPADGTEAGVFVSLSNQEMQAMTKRLRRHIISMIGAAGSGHPGGSLSAVEIVTALYFGILRHKPQEPCWPGRDRFILSKGHAAPLLYAVLAECGYFPVEELSTLRKLGSRLQGHTDCRLTPGVEVTAGALGQGLSIATGVALAGRLDSSNYRVYTLLGDGECNEGQVWEAAMAAAHFGVDNLVAIVDRNGLQLDGWSDEIMNLEPFAEKWQAFGWHTLVIDGHDLAAITNAVEHTRSIKGRPSVIIARTVKGKGVSFMENQVGFHGKAPSPDEVETALAELQ